MYAVVEEDKDNDSAAGVVPEVEKVAPPRMDDNDDNDDNDEGEWYPFCC